MAVRFRIRTPAGQELSFATLEVFKDFVWSGDLSPEDLVYDAEDGSWSPARAHPIVLDIGYAKEEEAEAKAKAAAAAAGPGDSEKAGLGLSLAPEQPRPEDEESEPDESVTAGGNGEAAAASDRIAPAASENAFGLDLAPESEDTDEEATRAFLEKMAAEREASMDFGPGSGVEGFSMDGSSALGDMLTPVPPAPAPAPPPPTRPLADPRPPAAPPQAPKPRDRRPEPTPASVNTRGGGGGFVRLLLVVIGLGLIGGAGYFGYQTFGVGEVVEPDLAVPMEPLPVEPEPTPEPVIAQTEMVIRERSQERFLASTQNALRELLPIPDSWGTGTYFSVPSDHPDVLAVWENYLRTIRIVRAAEDRRYANAYELALDDAAITADARAERRERALADFDLSDEARSAHYDRVEALASAAIQSHNALVESEGLILFDPGSGAAGEAGMGAGAFGRDAEADLLLSQVIDLLSGSLDGDGLGPGVGANVRAWVWDGFLDAATR